MPQKESPQNTGGLTKAGKSAISRIEDFELSDLDCIGQKWPEMKAGSKSVLYFLLAGSCLINPTQAAWASMQLVIVPVVVGILSGVMGVLQVGKAFEEDNDEESSDQNKVTETVDVSAKEVEEASSVTEFPTNSVTVRQGYRMSSEEPRPPTDEQEGEEEQEEPVFVDSPWTKPRKPRYQGEVYLSPEDKDSGKSPSQSTHNPTGVSSLSLPSSVKNRKSQAPDIEDLLQLSAQKRAEELLNQLELSGCDLWSYINDPILVCQGTQQSGKSTLAVIISVLEAAFYEKRINYITSNGDIYPVAFAAIGDGPEYYLQLADYLKTLQKDQGGEDIWITDELSKQPYEATSAVWNQLLSDFIKTGDTVRLIAHGTSAADMGLPKGRANQSKKEITILAAKRAVDVVGKKAARHLMKGGRYPSGQYQLQELQGDTLVDVPEERVQLPEWLQFETYTHPRTGEQIPCYVRSLLRYFPELDTRAKGAKPKVLFEETKNGTTASAQSESPTPSPEPPTSDSQIESARSSLQGLLDAVDGDSDPLQDVSELAQKLYAWITTGAGAKLWEQRETKTACLTIITRDNIISKGNKHWVDGATKSCHPFELADAISELVAIRKLSKTREGHVVVKTDWKSKEI